MWTKTLVMALALGLCGSAMALPAACEAPAIRTIARGSFSYRFEYHPATGDAPTVVFLPGGPGGTSIGQPLENLPAGYGYLNTDPRGVGCNEAGADVFPDEALTTSALADDVVEVIRASGLRNYLLYGQSYGTLLATVVANRLDKSDLPRPKAVVLEGTLGHAFESLDELNAEFVAQWERLKSTMPAGVRYDLEHDRFPFGLSAEEMGRAVQRLLVLSSLNGILLPQRVFALLSSTTPSELEVARGVLKQFSVPGETNEASRRLYRLIACREIAPGNNDSQSLVEGKLVASDPGLCRDLPFGPQKFDAKKFPVAEPIYYLNGERDPATPIAHMLYHYRSQSTGFKSYAIIPEAGHVPMKYSLPACAPEIWKGIDSGVKDLAPLAEPCARGIKSEWKNR